MATKFSRYDVADYLNSEEDMAAYLEACFEEAGDDATFIAAALGDIARAYGMVKSGRSKPVSPARAFTRRCRKTAIRASVRS